VGLFVGRHDNPIDKKGRVSIPAPFRAALGEPVRSIFLFPSADTKRGCMIVMSEPAMQRLIDKMKRGYKGMSGEEKRTAKLAVRAGRQLSVDENGRIQLPVEVSRSLGIGETVTFVGDGLYCSIWAPGRFDLDMDDLMSEPVEDGDDVLMGLVSDEEEDGGRRGQAMEGVDAR
jgi:MraZ protein